MRTDEYWMAEALRLAKQGSRTTTPNPNVGCLIVKDDKVVGSGFHKKAGQSHAEVIALSQAKDQAKGATAYVTLEPCSHFGKTPPCADGLINAGLARVVIAMLDPNPLVSGQGLKKLQAADIETRHGVLAPQSEALNPGFLKRMRTGRPYVQVKMAASLDGATAMTSGESQWITGPEARLDVQNFRAEACAVVTGVGTIVADNPALNVRLDGALRQPVRIILDPNGRTELTAKIVTSVGRTILVVSDSVEKQRMDAFKHAGFEMLVLPTNRQGIDLNALLDWAGAAQFNVLWFEAGATLTGSVMAEGLFDEVIYYQAPLFLGIDTRPVLKHAFTRLADGIHLKVLDSRFVGKDLRWRLAPE